MNNKIRNVLLKFMSNGYKAYVVGGYVRDFIMGKESYDVDICTNAKPKEIKELFELNNSTEDNYGSMQVKDSLYNYDITTFRKEISYRDRKPVEFEYIDDIDEDIIRRDFTINAIYMDIDGNIYDPYSGKEDIKNKVIRLIGSTQDKLTEDPLRILRAIRFASILDFSLEDSLFNYIRTNQQLIRTLSFNRRKEELDLIFKGPHTDKGLALIKDLSIMDELEINIGDNVVCTSDPLGIWAQIEYSDEYSFTKSDIELIKSIRKVLEYGIIDNVVLYQYGLYPCILASEILGINKAYVSDIYAKMPIYSSKNIKINGDEIISLLGVEPGEIIKDIIFDLELNILHNELENSEEAIKEYLLKNWR